MSKKTVDETVFEAAAQLFALLATPIRLKIICAVCEDEKTVNELLLEVPTTQPNMSQHLRQLYRSGVLAKRREGIQIVYSLQSERVAILCRAVCEQIQLELKPNSALSNADRLLARIGPVHGAVERSRLAAVARSD